jgi:hypothetical protein
MLPGWVMRGALAMVATTSPNVKAAIAGALLQAQ